MADPIYEEAVDMAQDDLSGGYDPGVAAAQESIAMEDQNNLGESVLTTQDPEAFSFMPETAPNAAMAQGAPMPPPDPLGGYRKYLNAMSQVYSQFEEPERTMTLGDRLGLFAVALQNPKLAHDTLAQRAQEETARRRQNLLLKQAGMQQAMKLGEAEQEAARWQKEFARRSRETDAQIAAWKARAANRTVGGLHDGLAQQIRQLDYQRKLEADRQARLDPYAKQREDYYALLLRPSRDPLLGEDTSMDPAEARRRADAAYPRPSMPGSGLMPESGDMSYPGQADDLGGLGYDTGPGGADPMDDFLGGDPSAPPDDGGGWWHADRYGRDLPPEPEDYSDDPMAGPDEPPLAWPTTNPYDAYR